MKTVSNHVILGTKVFSSLHTGLQALVCLVGFFN